VTNIDFLDSIHHSLLYLKEHFEDFILHPSSGKNLLVCANRFKISHINHYIIRCYIIWIYQEIGTSSIDYAQLSRLLY
jgi:hypothetical protein